VDLTPPPSLPSLITTRTSSVSLLYFQSCGCIADSVSADALAGGVLSSLDLGTQTQATGSSLSWNNVGNPSFTTTNYKPTMALAQNHIHFIGVPNSQPGTADIFVIHCEPSYPASSAALVDSSCAQSRSSSPLHRVTLCKQEAIPSRQHMARLPHFS
jgi:hypothetical protein